MSAMTRAEIEEIIRGLEATVDALDRTLAEAQSQDERARLEAHRREIQQKAQGLRQEARAA
jgi:hypothetical protein